MGDHTANTHSGKNMISFAFQHTRVLGNLWSHLSEAGRQWVTRQPASWKNMILMTIQHTRVTSEVIFSRQDLNG
jgi:hypothetical protein